MEFTSKKISHNPAERTVVTNFDKESALLAYKYVNTMEFNSRRITAIDIGSSIDPVFPLSWFRDNHANISRDYAKFTIQHCSWN